jgi:hypothetical protein
LPLCLAGRAPGFDPGRLGSNPRGAARGKTSKMTTARNSSVGRAEVSYASSAAGSIPASATIFLARSRHTDPARYAGLAKWEGDGSWPRHEAVRSRQPVRACSSSVERRIPNPRQRGFNSFLARHNRSGRAQRVARNARCSMSALGYRVGVCLSPSRVGEFRRHPWRVKRARHVRLCIAGPNLLALATVRNDPIASVEHVSLS